MQTIVDRYEDQFRRKADRKMTLEEVREYESRWEPVDSKQITFEEHEETM